MKEASKEQSSNINQATPEEEITEITIDGKTFEIKIKEIEYILENTVLKYFNKDQFSTLNNKKDLLSYFYKNEKECFLIIENLSKENSFPEYKTKLYKSIINELIMETFKQSPEKIVKDIFDSLKKIRNNINKKEINLEKFNKTLEEYFETKEIPKFLILNDLNYIEFKQKMEEKEKNRPEVKKIIEYYKKLKDGKIIPFEYFNSKKILFNIFILSNAKEIGTDKLIEDLLFNNYIEIRSWFNLNPDLQEYQNIFTNFIDISELEQKSVLESFLLQLNSELNKQNNKNEDLLLILIASFFYCIEHKMKDIKKNENEINDINSKIINFLKNTIETLSKYIKPCKYNLKSLINILFQYALSYIEMNKKIEKGENKIIENDENNDIALLNDNRINIFVEEENIDYDFELIEEIISHSNNNLKERFQQIKTKFKFESFAISKSLLGNIFQKVSDIFISKIYYHTNFIRLTPFQKYNTSNIVTILISGFGSENDAHCVSWKVYIENDPINSSYYFYQWPGDSFTKIIMKSLPMNFGQFVFDSNLPGVFDDSKTKAENSGKLLSIILLTKKFFKDKKINLVGFSLGSHVIKYCLKEMRDSEDSKNIINDVIFMGGATTFKKTNQWYNIFKKMVGGRVINCYSKKDDILSKLYCKCVGKDPIGRKELEIKEGKTGSNIIENYDFSDLELGHLDYRKHFHIILKRINQN